MVDSNTPAEDVPTGWWSRQVLGRIMKRAMKGIREDAIEKDEVNGTHVLDPDEDIKYELAERLDYDGAVIKLKPETQYVLPEDNVMVDNRVTLIGQDSSELTLADGVVSGDSTTPLIQFNAEGTELYGFTVDGNKSGNDSTADRYGVRFGPGAQRCKAIGVDVLNTMGDAWGDIRAGTQISHTHCEGFTEEAFDIKAAADDPDGERAVISHFTAEGNAPVQIRAQSDSATDWIGNVEIGPGTVTDTASRYCFNIDSTGAENQNIRNVRIHGVTASTGNQAVRFVRSSGDGDERIENVTIRDSRLYGDFGALYHGGPVRLANALFANNDLQGTEEIDLENCRDVTITSPSMDKLTDGTPEIKLDGAGGSGVQDVQFYVPGMSRSDITFDNPGSISRVTVNDHGIASQDPSSGGQWNGEGWDGLTVARTDLDDGTTHEYHSALTSSWA